MEVMAVNCFLMPGQDLWQPKGEPITGLEKGLSDWCQLDVKETIEHLIIECVGHTNERNTLVNAIKNKIGYIRWNRIIDSDDGAGL